jgi:Family of unknown function (DUF5996)
MRDAGVHTAEWPALPYEAWTDTMDTLHMYMQVIGKVRLALAPFEPQWANVPLYVTSRGLTTSPIPYGLRSFELVVDLVDHVVTVDTSDHQTRRIALGPRTVADFYAETMTALHTVGVDVEITPGPSEVPDPIPFAQDTKHSSYDAEWAHRFWHVLAEVDLVLKEHRAPFRGKTSPVHFFWGSFDLACTRFSGRPAEPHGDDIIMRLSTDAEQICAGFWPGNPAFSEAAFFAYPYPKPDAIEAAEVRPGEVFWHEDIGVFILRYDDARAASSPRRAILDFFESTYDAGARLLDWDPALVARPLEDPS